VPASIVASVVFLRIQDFARRPASEQARLRAQLEAVIAVTAAEIPLSERLVLEASDGAALVMLGDPRAALRLGTRALDAMAAGLPLSAGLDHGALQLSGRKGGEAMTGDGLAVAAAVAEFAAPGRLLASRSFRGALADADPGSEAALVPSGSFKDAGLRAHEVFAADEGGPGRRRRRYATLTAILVVALLGGGLGARLSHEGHQRLVNAFFTKVPYAKALAQRAGY
jgi:hypothetical protein